MTIDTTLPANDPLRFRKNLFDAYVFKNTNCKAMYKNDWKVAKISALSSSKFESEYSPLGKIFNKGLDKNDQKEGLFKRLKNIENAQKKNNKTTI